MMDCDRALDIVLEAADVDVAQLPEYRDALEHCRSCESCQAAARGIARLARIPSPTAPDGLAERVIAAVGAERAAARATEVMDADEPEPAFEIELPPVPLRPARPAWVTWVAVGSAAAAVVVGMFVFSRVGLSMMGARSPIVESAPTASSDNAAELAAGTRATADSTAPSGAVKAAPAVAPGFIAYRGWVWRVVEGGTPDRSGMTTAGDVTTDLGTGTTASLVVLTSPDRPETLMLVSGDGTLTQFSIVRRVYQGKGFGLVAGGDMPVFGAWPTLPGSIPRPVTAEGAPTFSQSGTDDTGVPVYPLVGADPATGFAIAPGTPVSDPAAGNPDWTWWYPLGN